MLIRIEIPKLRSDMKKIVVYSCLTNGYDPPADPAVVAEGVDYVLFTDAPVKSDVWQVRPFAKATDGFSNSLTARWHKTNPEALFPEYEYSLWKDANIDICSSGFYERLDELCSGGVLWAGLSHPNRDDTYEEGEAVLRQGKEKLCSLLRAASYLKRHGLPRHCGLFETNVVLRKHSDPVVAASDALWWKMVSTVTYRDQMSIMHVLRSSGISPEYIVPKGYCTRNHEFFRYVGSGHGKPYIKDRSLRGRVCDAAVMFRCILYRIYVAIR